MSDSDTAIDTVLDVGQFIRDQRTWRGDVPVARLTRLHGLLASDAGSIGSELVGRIENKKLWLDYSISGQVSLVCQRCLLPLAFPFDLAGELRVVDSLNELAAEDVCDEEWSVNDIEDAVIADHPLSLLELVEDEVVLALPMVATHPVCERIVAANDSDALSPFAALQALKLT